MTKYPEMVWLASVWIALAISERLVPVFWTILMG
jgi:hypothetical protein